MESESLLRSGGAGPKRFVLAGVVGLIAVVLGISISAIVLSVRALHESKDNAQACYYTKGAASFTAPNQTYLPVTTVIKNGYIWAGTGEVYPNSDILIVDGVIVGIASGIDPPEGANVYDAQGAFVTPGLVDMHSHVGVESFPNDAFATSDGNEMTDPDYPELRVIDAFNPNDPAIPLILSGGVTTSLVLPGSANLIGGQALHVKMKGGSVKNMTIAGAPLAFKFATGENPKRVYGARNQLPSTRLGNGWGFRKIFADATALKEQQDLWDCIQQRGVAQATSRPFDAALEPLVQVLREQALVNVHCYTVPDFEMVLRVADEFGFKIAAFHHALEAYRIPSEFSSRNITIATFCDRWGGKLEMFNASVLSPSILRAKGVQVALKSDHPVIYAKYLIHEAAKAHNYGLSVDDALLSVTAVPARAIGLGNRVGTLEPGKDGDVVIWNNHPLNVGAKPSHVFIEGILRVQAPVPGTPNTNPPQFNTNTMTTVPADACSNPSTSYAVVGSTLYTMVGNSGPVTDTPTILVENGTVTCVGTSTQCDSAGFTTYSLAGGFIVPGLISAASAVGLSEIEQESASEDGALVHDNSAKVFAANGIRLYARHVWAAYASGVTTQIAKPRGYSLVAGVSAAFYTQGTIALDSVFVRRLALHVSIGNDAKITTLTNSVSGQFALLRDIFDGFVGDNSSNPISLVLNGSLPIAFHVNQADEIGSVLHFKSVYNLTNVIIVGGAEAAVIAPLLAQQGVAVVLSPSQAIPDTFEKFRASDADIATLVNAGVTVAIAEPESGWVRNLRWNAGYAIANGLTYQQALASVTSNVAQIFQLPAGSGKISQGHAPNFVMYDGDPFTTGSKVAFIGLNSHTSCYPQQY